MKGLPRILLAALLVLPGTGAGRATPRQAAEPRSSDWLSLLPDGEDKRQFILDCTGCHQFDTPIVRANGQPRSRGDWEAATARMLGFAGATTGFPVIAHARQPGTTAD